MLLDPSSLPVICLLGPTASGKTEVAAELSQYFDLEIISVDAAQVYRGMNIGTAKPTQDFLRKYPHHLIDIRDPADTYSAADFIRDCHNLVTTIRKRRKVPLLVGGTMFYFHALEKGLSSLPAADQQIRRQLEQEIRESGLQQLHQQLAMIDPVIAKKIHPMDRQRLQRALEIHRQMGKPPSAVMTPATGGLQPLVKLTLFEPDRRQLHQRIVTRFDQMLEQGLVDEVETVASKFTDPNEIPSMRTVGYRQVLPFIRGQSDFAQMRLQGIAATRQLAKRQLTWLRQNANLVWFCRGVGVTRVIGRYLSAHPAIPQNVLREFFNDH